VRVYLLEFDEEEIMPEPTLAEKMEKILLDFVNAAPDVNGAALVDENGLPIATVLGNEVEEARVSAMSAAIVELGGRIVVELSKRELKRVLVDGEEGNVILVGAGDEAVLTVLTTKDAKLGMVFVDVNSTADRISTLLNERI
jgi:uncharacterized protein